MWSESGQAEGEIPPGDAEQAGAMILQFPNSGERGDQMRLRRALAALDTAMAEQRRAVAEWQAALGELSEAVGGLGGALQTQDRALGDLATSVAGLNGEATRLAAWSRLGACTQLGRARRFMA